MTVLYERIRQRRQELNISQDELAQRLGYKSRSSINKIEKGENDIPQSKIVKFASALNTTPEYLMGWQEKCVALTATPKAESTKLSPDEWALITKYRQFDSNGKKFVESTLNNLSQYVKKHKEE